MTSAARERQVRLRGEDIVAPPDPAETAAVEEHRAGQVGEPRESRPGVALVVNLFYSGVGHAFTR